MICNNDNSSLWVSQFTENAHPNRLEYIPKIDWGDENSMGNMDNRWEWLNGFTILYIRLHYRTNVFNGTNHDSCSLNPILGYESALLSISLVPRSNFQWINRHQWPISNKFNFNSPFLMVKPNFWCLMKSPRPWLITRSQLNQQIAKLLAP